MFWAKISAVSEALEAVLLQIIKAFGRYSWQFIETKCASLIPLASSGRSISLSGASQLDLACLTKIKFFIMSNLGRLREYGG